MKQFIQITLLLVFAGSFLSCQVERDVDVRPLLHPLFSDHAVLQRGQPVPVWGWAEPGTEVTLTFAGQTVRAIAGSDGKWIGTLQPLAAESSGRTITVKTGRKDLQAEARDVLVGDVWLCSGQSNMEMGIGSINEDEEIADADFPGIRLLTIPQKTAFQPQESFDADWAPCSPENLRGQGKWGGFSAVAYFFGKHLHRELEIPIGLIHSSWGGTQAEGWTSAEALTPFPAFHDQLAEVAAIANSTAEFPEKDYHDRWFRQHDPGTRQGWQEVATDTSDWRDVQLPGRWADCGIPRFEGIVWFQRQIDLPDDWGERKLVVNLGEISDNDTTWLNGEMIGNTSEFGAPRTYAVPEGLARPGGNVIAVRVTNAGGGGILADNHPLSIYPEGNPDEAISLSGPWKMQKTASKGETGRPLIGNPRVPAVLYNGMISPLEPSALAGVIWYQGEANASRAYQYRSLLPAMIQDWREKFNQEDLPFHIVSLAAYQQRVDQPRDSAWAELREAQAMTAQNVPHCGLAVAIDIGDADDIHPKNKREVGRRLALSALAGTYGRPVAGSGPWFKTIQVEGDAIRIRFDHTGGGGGLVFKGDTDRSFAVAGKDRKFVWAIARIDGEDVIVSAPEVPEPVAVRYAWDTNPQACLVNDAGLPAVPFRSDDWPGITENL